MMVEASNRAENLDMIELTLCRKRADKDGGGGWVKGLNCLPLMTRNRCHA